MTRGSSQPRDRTQVSHMWADSVLSEPPGKPKNTGVGSLSLLQRIFPTQESNWGLLHCRQILYQLSSQGSPDFCVLGKIWIEHDIYICKIFCSLELKLSFFVPSHWSSQQRWAKQGKYKDYEEWWVLEIRMAGWMASLIQWTWTWANSGRHRETGKPGMLQSTGLWGVGHFTTARLNNNGRSVWPKAVGKEEQTLD